MDNTPTSSLPGSGAFPSSARAGAGKAEQAITGLIAPALGEALIRECRPTVVSFAGPATLARALIKSVILAPLGWLMLAPLFALKFAPFVSKRYTLTNRRLMIRHGLKGTPGQSVLLADIEEVRLVTASEDAFYLSATLEIVSGGQVRMTLPAVPEPQGFRQAILNSCAAWVPGKSKALYPFDPADSKAKG